MRASEEQRAALERDARAACDRGDYGRAASEAVRGYGPEVFGLVASLHADADEAADVFSDATEALFRSLPTFAWGCSLRTWFYTLARNASHRTRRDAGRRGRRVRRAADDSLDAVVAAVRTETVEYLRTATRTRFQALRDALPEEDRLLLVLRVDRGLSWTELAHVLGGGELDAAAAAREAARLRKRFQRVKDDLAEAVRNAGAAGSDDG